MQPELIDRIIDVCGGNPGAVNVCVCLLQNFGEFGFSLLEKSGLQGSNIWCLYKDECQEDITKMLNVLNSRYNQEN